MLCMYILGHIIRYSKCSSFNEVTYNLENGVYFKDSFKYTASLLCIGNVKLIRRCYVYYFLFYFGLIFRFIWNLCIYMNIALFL